MIQYIKNKYHEIKDYGPKSWWDFVLVVTLMFVLFGLIMSLIGFWFQYVTGDFASLLGWYRWLSGIPVISFALGLFGGTIAWSIEVK